MALSFLFGGDTQETPESIKRKRDIARALLASRAPQNVGEGISALGDGIVSAVLNSRADKAEKAGQQNMANDWAPLESAFGGGSSTPGATGSSMPKVDAAGNVAMPSAGGGDLPQSFLAAVDKTEGAGDYDTLFGHSQKSGPFAGTAISQMPIKDVLAFTDPSGAYAQFVKGKVGRVATPVGKYQTVGTTLRNAVDAMGLDPNLPYDKATQDRVASYLARQRIASADTLPGKIQALRSEWQGFNNVPDSEMAQIVADLQAAPTASAGTEVASLDPSAGMPPTSPIQPPVIPPAPPPTPGYRDPMVTTEGRAPAPVQSPAPVQQPSPAVVQALTAPQKGGRLGTPPQPLSDADFNSRFGADDTGAIPPQIAPQSALPPLPVTEVGPTPNVASVPPVADTAPQPNQEVAQALLRQDRSGVGIGGDAPGAGYFPASPNAQAQGPSQQQIMRVLTNPYASEAQKAVANALLQRQMDESDPSTQLDREYKRAQIGALTGKQAGYTVLTPAERKSLGIPDTDQRVYQKGPNGQIDAVGGVGQTINIGNEVDQRRAAAAQAGLKPEDPAYQGFILTGKLPKENEQSLTSTDKKAILEADEMVQNTQNVLPLLDRALELNKKAYSGPGAGIRSTIMGAVGNEDALATQELDNVVTAGALQQLKAIFGGAPTEGERSILLDMSGASSKPPEVRKSIYERAKQLAQRRLEFYKDRANDIRGGTYYKPAEMGQMPSVPDSQQAPAQATPSQPQAASRPRATNPQTGETLEFDGTQWVPVK